MDLYTAPQRAWNVRRVLIKRLPLGKNMYIQKVYSMNTITKELEAYAKKEGYSVYYTQKAIRNIQKNYNLDRDWETLN